MSAKAPRTSYDISSHLHRHAFLRPRSLREFSTSWPLSAYKPAKAPTTFDKEDGRLSSYRTKTLAKQLMEKRAMYPLSIRSSTSWTQIELLKMGIPSKVRESCIEFAFFGQVYQESPKARIGYWQDTFAKNYNLSNQTGGRIFCVIGLPLLREPYEAWQNFGVYVLECAVELGNYLAALHLCALENRSARFKGGISQKARDLLEDLALEGKDWRALAIRVEYLLPLTNRPAKLEEAFELAKALVDITEADPEGKEEGAEFIPHIQPWRMLRDAAVLTGDTKAQIKATRLGARQYNDPEACWFAANDTKLHSKEWVELMTRAAMGGRNKACHMLGMYWLMKDGWYPCPARPSLSKVRLGAESTIGFGWLELAAAGRSPLPARDVFAGMALVYRENNRPKLGLDCLKSGIDSIEAGSGHPADKEEAVAALRGLIQDWSADWSKSFGTEKSLSEDFSAAIFLE